MEACSSRDEVDSGVQRPLAGSAMLLDGCWGWPRTQLSTGSGSAEEGEVVTAAFLLPQQLDGVSLKLPTRPAGSRRNVGPEDSQKYLMDVGQSGPVLGSQREELPTMRHLSCLSSHESLASVTTAGPAFLPLAAQRSDTLPTCFRLPPSSPTDSPSPRRRLQMSRSSSRRLSADSRGCRKHMPVPSGDFITSSMLGAHHDPMQAVSLPSELSFSTITTGLPDSASPTTSQPTSCGPMVLQDMTSMRMSTMQRHGSAKRLSPLSAAPSPRRARVIEVGPAEADVPESTLVDSWRDVWVPAQEDPATAALSAVAAVIAPAPQGPFSACSTGGSRTPSTGALQGLLALHRACSSTSGICPATASGAVSPQPLHTPFRAGPLPPSPLSRSSAQDSPQSLLDGAPACGSFAPYTSATPPGLPGRGAAPRATSRLSAPPLPEVPVPADEDVFVEAPSVQPRAPVVTTSVIIPPTTRPPGSRILAALLRSQAAARRPATASPDKSHPMPRSTPQLQQLTIHAPDLPLPTEPVPPREPARCGTPPLLPYEAVAAECALSDEYECDAGELGAGLWDDPIQQALSNMDITDPCALLDDGSFDDMWQEFGSWADTGSTRASGTGEPA